MSEYDGMGEIELKDEQISFEDGHLVDEVAKAEIPIETAVIDDAPEMVVEDVTVEAPVEVVTEVEQPVAVMEEVVETPVYTEVAPVVAEAVEPVKHAVWPWALGALALAGLATALAWPHSTPAPVAEPVVTPTVVAAPVTPAPTQKAEAAPLKISKAAPTCAGGELATKVETRLMANPEGTDRSMVMIPANTTLEVTGDSYVTMMSGTREDLYPVTVDGGATGYINATDIYCMVTVTG